MNCFLWCSNLIQRAKGRKSLLPQPLLLFLKPYLKGKVLERKLVQQFNERQQWPTQREASSTLLPVQEPFAPAGAGEAAGKLQLRVKTGFRNVIPLVLVVQPFRFACYAYAFLEGGTFRFQKKISRANSAHHSHHKLPICGLLRLFQMASSYSKTSWTWTISKVNNQIWSDLEKCEGFDDLSSNNFKFIVKADFKMLILFPENEKLQNCAHRYKYIR